MCLAIPGQIRTRYQGDGDLLFAQVRFGSVTREVCLAYTPEARVGQYVIVHVGFAIQVLDEDAAAASLRELERLGEVVDDASVTRAPTGLIDP